MKKIQVCCGVLLACFSMASSLAFADPVWIDVRTLSESLRNNIPGDLRISHSNIVREVTKLYPDKSTEIHLYDKTGGRSDIAMSALERAGYEFVTNEGSIEEAKQKRGLN
ncbi:MULTISPECIES: rhodanese-like domain-containing protein [unclassified Psychromonas]|uniref:rhodanese-like domain-containing protein n=1 Tax=unclassified Psychromonas TaxID=2614957 RepID=UPI00215DB843|nr:rhodanese-like domain-containing protein [Psychromonas sp. B3M02]